MKMKMKKKKKRREDFLRRLRGKDRMSNVLVFIEQRDGKLRKSSLEALSLGYSLSKKTNGTLGAVIAGSGISSLSSELAAYGAAKVFVADKPELALFYSEDYKAELVYFMAIDRAKFRKPVLPGDQIHYHVKKIRNRGRVWRFFGEAKVDGKTVAEAEVSAMLADSADARAFAAGKHG